ncbi:MAG: efflux RND transporter periplasmic adaptor subunit [Pseudomonadota bacterium]
MRQQDAKTGSKTGIGGWMLALLLAGTATAGGWAAVEALYARAAAPAAAEARPPVPVAVVTVALSEGYTVRERFVGRVEPARATWPAAERAGLLIEIAVDEGDAVDEGALLARLDTRELDLERTRLVAEREGLDADIALAERTAERRDRLVGEGWASGQATDEARFALTALRARKVSVEAAIARLDLDLEKSEIRAPFDGVVAARQVDEGAVVSAGTRLVEVLEIARPQARIGVPADRVGALSVGDDVTLTHRGAALAGRVAAIAPAMQAATRTVPVLIDLDADAGLAMGEIVRLEQSRTVPARGAWVPLAALKEAERGLWSVQTVVERDDSAVIGREVVEVLHLDGARAYVRGSLADGARVVAEGAHRIGRGDRVAPMPVPVSAPAAADVEG